MPQANQIVYKGVLNLILRLGIVEYVEFYLPINVTECSTAQTDVWNFKVRVTEHVVAHD